MDSKFEKWNELPTEMRFECVKWMDFQSRMSLRGASKSEKSLVERAPKIHFDSVKVELAIHYEPSVTCKQGSVETVKIEHKIGEVTSEFLQKAQHFVVQLFKFSVIDHLEFYNKSENDFTEFCSRICDVAPMKFKSVQMSLQDDCLTKMFLERFEKIEKLFLDTMYMKDNMLVFFDSVCSSKTVQLIRTGVSMPHYLVQNWIKHDAEVGTTLQVGSYGDELLNYFANEMKERVISKSDTDLRLRTDNPAKHILLRGVSKCMGYASFLIIPADQKESEYEKDDQWIQDFVKYSVDKEKRGAKQFVSMCSSLSREIKSMRC